nr:hypothetical protein [uncultured Dethiosulfovibrio sp.]
MGDVLRDPATQPRQRRSIHMEGISQRGHRLKATGSRFNPAIPDERPPVFAIQDPEGLDRRYDHIPASSFMYDFGNYLTTPNLGEDTVFRRTIRLDVD